MKRFAEAQLLEWFKRKRRKPLVLRGARQVGKSTLVRNFAKKQNLHLIEVNLERHYKLRDSICSFDVKKILEDIDFLTSQKIAIPQNTLLFFDEIQAIPETLAVLRYFYEEMPELPIISAGSLLEFVLSDHAFSMPVGRIEFMYLGPMTFKEFLLASESSALLEALEKINPLESRKSTLSEAAVVKFKEKLNQFFYVGGMPEAMQSYIETGEFRESRRVQQSIIDTYRDDFAKYRKRIPQLRLDRAFEYAALNVGKKIKYSNISEDDKSRELKVAIELLVKARLLAPVYHSSCSGLPIKAGMNQKIYKLLFIDIGLMNCVANIDWNHFKNLGPSGLLNQGMMAEQFVGQHLMYRNNGMNIPELFYWLREGRANNAEVDYVIDSHNATIPIEVKSGKTGAIRSLIQFMYDKKSPIAVKLDLNSPSLQKIDQKLSTSTPAEVQFKLLSLPLYAIEELERILTAM